MKIVEVNTDWTKKEFLTVVDKIYAKDKFYVRPLNQNVEAVFNPLTNPNFEHGKAVRYILVNDKNQSIGRISAFINFQKVARNPIPTGAFGFFECINDAKAAKLLFDSARIWLLKNGMASMVGPISFGDNHLFHGALVEGFMPPFYSVPYNPSYYKELYENYGFTIKDEQSTYHLDVSSPLPERFWKIADWVAKKSDFTYRHFEWSELDKFVSDFKIIYDQAWNVNEKFVPISKARIAKILKRAEPIIWEDMIWFAYNRNTPIGMLVVLPDVNQVIKPFKGEMNWVNKILFVIRCKLNVITRGRVMVLGIVPHYQKHGIESGLIYYLKKALSKRKSFSELEMSVVSHFNPKLKTLHEAVGAEFAKRHCTYRRTTAETL